MCSSHPSSPTKLNRTARHKWPATWTNWVVEYGNSSSLKLTFTNGWSTSRLQQNELSWNFIFCVLAAAAAYVLHSTFHPKLFLGTFTKLQKPTICFIMSACLSICPSTWNNPALTGTIFIKLGIWEFFWKSVKEIQVSLESDKNNGYYTWGSIYIFNHILLSTS